MRDIYRIKYDAAIDADGHILEPPDLWERYLEPQYRDRALRIRVDDDGLEYLEIGGRASQLSRRGFPGTLGAMGKMHVEDVRPSPERTYLDAAVLYPTIGILWEAELPDAELSLAYCRAYNRWIADFCRDSRGRLVPIAHLSLGDPARDARSARAVRASHDRSPRSSGCRRGSTRARARRREARPPTGCRSSGRAPRRRDSRRRAARGAPSCPSSRAAPRRDRCARARAARLRRASCPWPPGFRGSRGARAATPGRRSRDTRARRRRRGCAAPDRGTAAPGSAPRDPAARGCDRPRRSQRRT